jgi:methyl-accepting chemotaxis protein
MRNLRFGLRAKLMTAATVLLAFTVAVGVYGILDLRHATHQAEALVNETALPIAELGRARAQFNDTRALVNEHILEDSAAAKAELEKAIAENDALLAELDGELVATVGAYREQRERILELSRAGRADAAHELVETGARPAADAVSEAFDGILVARVKAAQSAHATMAAAADTSRTRSIVLIVVAVLAGFGLTLWFSRRLSVAVNTILERLTSLRDHCATELAHALGRVAEGDLTVAVEPVTPELRRTSNDEIGDIAAAVGSIRDATFESVHAYNAMRAQLGATIAELSGEAQTVASASQQMAATSEEAGRAVSEIATAVTEVADGAERQVRGVEATRAAVQQAAQSASTSASVAVQTAQAAEGARAAALEGVDAAASASAVIREIAEAAGTTAQAIDRLNEHSERIGGIVGTITGLAEQTNLLALNAAIEAARAGEQGRGFAVVAEEVRKLAEESQRSAAEIAGLIGEVQTETARAVSATADGAELTRNGVATAERAREAFTAIGSVVDDMAARVTEISTAVEQISSEASRAEAEVIGVAAVAEESSASAEQVSASTQQTSASAQEIAASAQTLSGTAEHLNALVARFTVAA